MIHSGFQLTGWVEKISQNELSVGEPGSPQSRLERCRQLRPKGARGSLSGAIEAQTLVSSRRWLQGP